MTEECEGQIPPLLFGRRVTGMAAASCVHAGCNLVHIFVGLDDGTQKPFLSFSPEVAAVFVSQIEKAIEEQKEKRPDGGYN